jgi:hypothetical protein
MCGNTVENPTFEQVGEKFTKFKFENAGDQVRSVIGALTWEQVPLDFRPCRIHGHCNEKVDVKEEVCQSHTVLASLV